MGGEAGAAGADRVEDEGMHARRAAHGIGLLALAGHDRNGAVGIADLRQEHRGHTLFLL
jgi:hypothetical protein